MALRAVTKYKVDDIDGAFVSISHSIKDSDFMRTHLCYFLDNGDGTGVEWEPTSGPFTLINRVAEGHPESKKHWYFDFCDGYGRWGQLAVEETGIQKYLAKGDLKMVFSIMRRFK